MDSDIRTFTFRDPRANSNNVGTMASAPAAVSQNSTPAAQPARPPVAQTPSKPGSSSDTEKVIFILHNRIINVALMNIVLNKPNCFVFQAALIMQVLQLTDEQIAKLPAEQRQSILVLKEQIAKSAQR